LIPLKNLLASYDLADLDAHQKMVSAAYQPLTSWDDLGYSFYLVVRKSRNTVDGRNPAPPWIVGTSFHHGINDLTNGAGSLPSTLCLLLCHGLFCVGCNKSQLLVANIWVVYGVVQFIINSYVYIFYTSTSVLNRGPTIYQYYLGSCTTGDSGCTGCMLKRLHAFI
jgi:hypothetical protein